MPAADSNPLRRSGAPCIPDESMLTGFPMKAAPAIDVPPVSLTGPPFDVDVRSVTSESMVSMPSRSKWLTLLTAWVVTVEPSDATVVVATDDIDPTVTIGGAVNAGVVAVAFDAVSAAFTRASSPGPGDDSAAGAPVPDVALTRYGYGGSVPGFHCAKPRLIKASGLSRRSPGSATDARANVDGPVVIVARASGMPMSTGAATGSRPCGL